MKRIFISFLLFLSSLSLFAAPSIGYSLGLVGGSTPRDAYGAVNIALIISPDRHIHAGDLEISVDLSGYGTVFQSANVKLYTPIYMTTKHIFNSLFPNTIVWSLMLGTGVEYRLGNEWSILLSLSPFYFHDNNYAFEFFAPYILYSITAEEWGWGMYVIRFSYFFGDDA